MIWIVSVTLFACKNIENYFDVFGRGWFAGAIVGKCWIWRCLLCLVRIEVGNKKGFRVMWGSLLFLDGFWVGCYAEVLVSLFVFFVVALAESVDVDEAAFDSFLDVLAFSLLLASLLLSPLLVAGAAGLLLLLSVT